MLDKEYYEKEYNAQLDILVKVRDALLPLVIKEGNVCGDMGACAVSNPACIGCLAEQIAKQYKQQSEKVERMEMMYENTGSIMNRRHLMDKVERYEEALKYISEIEQPDGGYVSRLDVAVTKAKQVLEKS